MNVTTRRASEIPAQKEPKKIGRPRIASGLSNVEVTLRATPTEWAEWRRLANGRSLSSWLRALANAAAK